MLQKRTPTKTVIKGKNTKKEARNVNMIYDLFLKPFVDCMRRNGCTETTQGVLEQFFHVPERKLFVGITNNRVEIKGELMTPPRRPQPGIVKNLPKGILLWIRIDEKEAHHVDVEFDYYDKHASDAEIKTYVFRLTNTAFLDILREVTLL